MHIGFIQSFGIGDNGGGSRILRSLITNQPFTYKSICTSNPRPRDWNSPNGGQYWVPLRSVTRLDRTRFQAIIDKVNPIFIGRLRRRVFEICESERFDLLHVVPHGAYDWQIAAEYCRKTRTPLVMSMHDDIRYVFPRDIYIKHADAFAIAWQQAAHVFCISTELGEEYCRRYGQRQFEIITDGVEKICSEPQSKCSGRLRVYFCGLLHYAYLENFTILLSSLKKLAPNYKAELVLRGAFPFAEMKQYSEFIHAFPFSSDIASDFEAVDVLYLPLPLAERCQDFFRYSLSTKLITYLATGVPILYHGPAEGALFNILKRSEAAALVTTDSCEALCESLTNLKNTKGDAVTRSALSLAVKEFWLPDLQRRFLAALKKCARTNQHPIEVSS